ncbi:MAG: hypothetical protein LBK25_05770 [Treponema sp.]|nr:hypothetical protein [Treponema sp.]
MQASGVPPCCPRCPAGTVCIRRCQITSQGAVSDTEGGRVGGWRKTAVARAGDRGAHHKGNGLPPSV